MKWQREQLLQSMKTTDDLGRFGLGLISPLGKCETFSFISMPKGGDCYRRWTFDCAAIADQADVRIPMTVVRDLKYALGTKTVKNAVVWRTRVEIRGLVADRVISRLDQHDIQGAIITRYGAKMRRNDVMVQITFTDRSGERITFDVRAPEFNGEPLPVHLEPNECGGETKFRLFLAQVQQGRRRGRVLFGEADNDFRLEAKDFLRSVQGTELDLSNDLKEALLSGVFEGEVLGDQIELQANRKAFVFNDNLLGFCLSLENWYTNVGQEVWQRIKQEAANNRFQEISLAALSSIEDLLKSDRNNFLREVISSFKDGSIGQGHFPRDGHIDNEAQSLHGQHSGRSGQKDKRSEWSMVPAQEHLDHIPLTVTGKGPFRVRVKSNSLGLEIAEGVLLGDHLWELDSQCGRLTVNTAHPLWTDCATISDRALQIFEEGLIIEALIYKALPETMRLGWLEGLKFFDKTTVQLLAQKAVSGKKRRSQ